MEWRAKILWHLLVRVGKEPRAAESPAMKWGTLAKLRKAQVRANQTEVLEGHVAVALGPSLNNLAAVLWLWASLVLLPIFGKSHSHEIMGDSWGCWQGYPRLRRTQAKRRNIAETNSVKRRLRVNKGNHLDSPLFSLLFSWMLATISLLEKKSVSFGSWWSTQSAAVKWVSRDMLVGKSCHGGCVDKVRYPTSLVAKWHAKKPLDPTLWPSKNSPERLHRYKFSMTSLLYPAIQGLGHSWRPPEEITDQWK